MEERFKRETQALIRAWMQHDREMLRDYLVQDVQDPRINVQSILTRHFLMGRLFPGRFEALMEHELRFSVVMNWLLELMKASAGAELLQALLFALLDGADDAEGLEVPRFVSETFAALPGEADGVAVPDYIGDVLVASSAESTRPRIGQPATSTFQALWHQLLEDEQPQGISVLEPGCGSANDYRFLEASGIARLLDYTGFDLCEKNIRNAREMFPDVRFEVGNVLEIDAPEDAFDYCFVHDLFEHLSIEAMELAIAEVCRVTRQGICVGFFNMHDGEQHVVNPVEGYHRNNLSMAKTKAVFERHASAVQVAHIDGFLTSRFGCDTTHNKGAYTFIVSM